MSVERLVERAENNLKAAAVLIDNELYADAISRMYYAMFHIAAALLLQRKNLTFSSHKGVVSAFGQHFVTTGEISKDFHRYLVDAEKERTKADYATDVEFTEAATRLQLQQAQAFVAMGKGLLSQDGGAA